MAVLPDLFGTGLPTPPGALVRRGSPDPAGSTCSAGLPTPPGALVRRGSPDPAGSTSFGAGLPTPPGAGPQVSRLETFGRRGGKVGRPCHKMCLAGDREHEGRFS